jgi:hypothetical protein
MYDNLLFIYTYDLITMTLSRSLSNSDMQKNNSELRGTIDYLSRQLKFGEEN